LQLRKECHEEYEEIEAKETDENREIPEEILKEIEESKIQELTGEDKDVEWEFESIKPSNSEEIKGRKREYMFGSKEETFFGHMKQYSIGWA
jgi:hypothetical protein